MKPNKSRGSWQKGINLSNYDLLSGSFFFIFSIIICVESFEYGLGELREPGAGFFPFWIGVVFASLSLFLIMQSLYREPASHNKNLFEKIRWKKWILTVASLSAYAFLLEPLGFILCTFALMIVLLVFVEPQRWIIVLLVTTISTAGAYVLFQWVLKAQLPQGILGF